MEHDFKHFHVKL